MWRGKYVHEWDMAIDGIETLRRDLEELQEREGIL
jgi:hypothetical protein